MKRDGLSPEALAEVKNCAARGRKQAAMLHSALVQRLREEMWLSLSDGLDLETVRVLMPILMTARRLEKLDESDRDGDSRRKLGVKGEQRAMRKLWGTLPEWHPGAAKNQKTPARKSAETVAEPGDAEKCSPAQPQQPAAAAMGESWEARAAAQSPEGLP
jgi:hypothetical protein